MLVAFELTSGWGIVVAGSAVIAVVLLYVTPPKRPSWAPEVVVSNSRVVANAQGRLTRGFGSKNGTALRVSPQRFAIAGSNGPAEPVIFDEV